MHSLLTCCALYLTLLLCNNSAAADNTYLDTSGAKPVSESQVVTARPMRLSDNDAQLFSVRCWQNGELIIDEASWSAPQLSASFLAMRKAGSPSPGIYLVDFQNSFCELKQRQVPQ